MKRKENLRENSKRNFEEKTKPQIRIWENIQKLRENSRELALIPYQKLVMKNKFSLIRKSIYIVCIYIHKEEEN